MKIKILLVGIFLVFAFSVCTFAQIKITPNKVTYKRTGKDIPEHKKTFEINYPKISGIGPVREIENTISYWKNFNTTLAEEMDNDFLGQMDYKVNYNSKGVLDIELIMSGAAAYPTESLVTLVIDLETGKQIKIKDAFQNRTKLYNKIAQAQQKEKDKALAEIKIQNKDKYEDLVRLFEETEIYQSIYEIDEFSINDKGVTFIFDYDFVHAVKVLQPEGRYFFTWAEMKPFIKDYEPLESFISSQK